MTRRCSPFDNSPSRAGINDSSPSVEMTFDRKRVDAPCSRITKPSTQETDCSAHGRMPSGTKKRCSLRLEGVIGASSIAIVPWVAGVRPATHRKSVVFPEPFGPMRPRISPGRIAKLASRNAQNPPNRLASRSTRIVEWVADSGDIEESLREGNERLYGTDV